LLRLFFLNTSNVMRLLRHSIPRSDGNLHAKTDDVSSHSERSEESLPFNETLHFIQSDHKCYYCHSEPEG